MMRSFRTAFHDDQLTAYQSGVLSYRYRGVPCLKSPLDLAIYLRLIDEVRPRTLIEIGSFAGGSALLFRDVGRMLEIPLRVVSIDLQPPGDYFDGIRFLQGNIAALALVFAENALYGLPRPWLVVEDSAHTAQACRAALDFFAGVLRENEWLVMEDGVLSDLGMGERYGGGPNTAIAQFFDEHADVFQVGTQYCDMFGVNATYNPNGYLRRTAAPFSEGIR